MSATSLQDKSRKRTDPRRYVDSANIPYVALPREMRDMGMQLGDVAMVVHAKTGAACCAIFADVGPRGKLGEGSVALAQALGIPSSPKNGGTERPEIVYLTFPGSSLGWPVSRDQIEQRAQSLFAEWGGMDQLHACFVDRNLAGQVVQSKSVPVKTMPSAKAKSRKVGAGVARARLSKLVVTNWSSLLAKYGEKIKLIRLALDELIAADEARGLSVRLLCIDAPTDMKSVRGKPAGAGDPRSTKRAIDAAFKKLRPEYLLILGGPDVIPMIPLSNPCYSETGDDDPVVPSDLPYASSAPYGIDPTQFLGPTRIVGRLPDIPGESDPQFLVKLLRTAATWTERERAEYQRYFAISAQEWKKSTTLSVATLFGTSQSLQTVPPGGPDWADSYLGRKLHFINCHGSPSDTQFYGQRGDDYPVAQKADELAARISPGTVVAAECCYGAQLYSPEDTQGQPGICLSYLDNGAYAFLGSSTIAYGPSAGNGQADLLCRYFAELVLSGASTGRALIEARHRFASGYSHLDPTDIKTMAQFYLLGDPSIHPVKVEPHALAHTKTYQKVFAKGDHGVCALRRERITRTGTNLHNTLGTVIEHAEPPSDDVLRLLESAAKESGLESVSHKSFAVSFPKAASQGELRPFAERRSGRTIHMTSGRVGQADSDGIPRIVSLVATVEDGEIVHLRRVHSR